MAAEVPRRWPTAKALGPRPTAQPEAERVDDPQPEARKGRKTRLCIFYVMGTCKNGDDCTFAHGEHEQERAIDWEEKPKKRLCKNYPGFCTFGRNCAYAHGQGELQERLSEQEKYKTRHCRFFLTDTCVYGAKCTFAHGDSELNSSVVADGQAIPESASDATPQCEAGADCKHSDCAKLHPRRKSPCHSSSNCVNVDCKHLHPACWDPFANAQSLVIIIPKKGSADSEALALRLSEDFSVKRGLLMNPATKKVAVMVEMYTPEAAQDLARQIHGKELAEQRVAAFPAATPEPWLALQDMDAANQTERAEIANPFGQPAEGFNQWGLPVRDESARICSNYQRTGSCAFGSTCKFHHEDEAAYKGGKWIAGQITQEFLVVEEDGEIVCHVSWVKFPDILCTYLIPVTAWPLECPIVKVGGSIWCFLTINGVRNVKVQHVPGSIPFGPAQRHGTLQRDNGKLRLRLDVGVLISQTEGRTTSVDTISVEPPDFRAPIEDRVTLQLKYSHRLADIAAKLHCPPKFEFVQCDDGGYLKARLQSLSNQRVAIQAKPFKSLETLSKELWDIQRTTAQTGDGMAIAGLQPRSTGAFEDFCRFVILDGFMRLVHAMDDVIAKLKQTPSASTMTHDANALANVQTWLVKVFKWQQQIVKLSTNCADCSNLIELEKQFTEKKGLRESKRQGAESASPTKRKDAEAAFAKAEQELKASHEAMLEGYRNFDWETWLISTECCIICNSHLLTCPLCKRAYCFQCDMHSDCMVSDVHPTDARGRLMTERDRASKLLTWALSQTLCHQFMTSKFDVQKGRKQSFQEMQPLLREWVPALKHFLPDLADGRTDTETLVKDKMQSILTSQVLTRLSSPHLDGVEELLRLKYGIRCSAVHGSVAATLQGALSCFPTAKELQQSLLNGRPRRGQSSRAMQEGVPNYVPDLTGGAYWDLYWITVAGLLTKDQKQDMLSKDWRQWNPKDDGKDYVIRRRAHLYKFQHESIPDGVNEVEVSVECVSNGRDPTSTAGGILKKQGESWILTFRLHFCYEVELEKNCPHKWMSVKLTVQEGRMDGVAVTCWDDVDSGLSRGERHFERGDDGTMQYVQLYPEEEQDEESGQEEERAGSEEAARFKAAKHIARSWRMVYERIEHCERHASLRKVDIVADLDLTRVAAVMLSNTVVQVCEDCFGITIAEQAKLEQDRTAFDFLPACAFGPGSHVGLSQAAGPGADVGLSQAAGPGADVGLSQAAGPGADVGLSGPGADVQAAGPGADGGFSQAAGPGADVGLSQASDQMQKLGRAPCDLRWQRRCQSKTS